MSLSETPTRPLLHGIQAVRGFFSLLVVCHHVGVHSQRFWDHDWLGGTFNHSVFRVDFFFVLSGFVLWAVHRAEAGSIGTGLSFLRRRLWRLYPLLFMLTLIKVLLLWVFPGRSPESYQIIHSLLALPQTNFPVIVSAWTLSFEVFRSQASFLESFAVNLLNLSNWCGRKYF
jgi:peptidoglycan/LPS O-acetylase OafA/YrhL